MFSYYVCSLTFCYFLLVQKTKTNLTWRTCLTFLKVEKMTPAFIPWSLRAPDIPPLQSETGPTASRCHRYGHYVIFPSFQLCIAKIDGAPGLGNNCRSWSIYWNWGKFGLPKSPSRDKMGLGRLERPVTTSNPRFPGKNYPRKKNDLNNPLRLQLFDTEYTQFLPIGTVRFWHYWCP